jgi:hypothetical protein
MSNGNSPDSGLLSELGRQAAQVGSTAFGLPRRIEDTIDKLERGDLRIRTRSTETDRVLRRLSNVNIGTNYALLTGAFTLSATILIVNHFVWLAAAAAVAAAAAAIALIRVMIRLDRYERMF